MYINAVGQYVPEDRIHNDHFFELNGLTDDWIFQRTGIKTRSRVSQEENGFSMGKNAVADAMRGLPYAIEDVDLIVSAGYSPIDTVGTLGHRVQREFNMGDAVVMMVSSACSSFVNACEIVEAYFESGKASKALVVCSEHNSYYANESDDKAGHLWGDAAVAVFLSKEPCANEEPRIMHIATRGLGHVGKGPEGVMLRPKDEGIVMPDGRDVFVNATFYMLDTLKEVLDKQDMELEDLDYIAAHQANMRIIKNIANQAGLGMDKLISNIEELGNTGSASAMLVAIQHWETFKSGDKLGLTVFGGGYSSGAMLICF